MWAPNGRYIWVSSWSLISRLVFCWIYTSTQVNKLIGYSNQYITSPWAWNCQKTDRGPLFKQCLFIVILVKLRTNGTRWTFFNLWKNDQISFIIIIILLVVGFQIWIFWWFSWNDLARVGIYIINMYLTWQ